MIEAQSARKLLITIVVASLLMMACSKGGATASGTVVRGERERHLVRAKAGQTLEVSITSEENNAVFQIFLPGEKETLPKAGETDDATKWSGQVPADGDYVISVGATRGNAAYKLTHSVE